MSLLIPKPILWLPKSRIVCNMGGYPCCCGEGPCSYCNGTPPDTIQVNFSGVTDSNCSECDTYWNDSFILNKDGTNPCLYTYTEDPFTCSNISCDPDEWHEIDIRLLWVMSGSDYILRVSVDECECTSATTDTCFQVALFEKNYGSTKPDCTPASTQTLTRISAYSHIFCNWTSASCTVEAAP